MITIATIGPSHSDYQDDVWKAVKSADRHINYGRQYKCVLLHTGQLAHFPEGNETLVREIILFTR